ncbi:MAG: Sel1 domain protein repeat-containing protein [Verrucomicrobiales bacterium]|nr:Sel1 domain protein repeat-containing protein [Verrucomicrobiales bacterium]
MFPRTAFAPLLTVLALGLWLPAPASAKFVSPMDVAKDPALVNIFSKLKKAGSPADSKPQFEALLKIVAEGGTPEQIFTLGYLHQYGIGTPVSTEKALAAYQKAADAGNMGAKNNLGLLMIASGTDAAKGVAMVETAANAGDSASQCTLGQLYLDGLPALGLTKDQAKARAWFEKSAAKGDADAAWSIAAMLANKPQATAAEVQEAIPWLEKAVKAENLPALVNYGLRLATGAGLDADPTRGISMLQTAVAKGSPQAVMAMAGLYETGGGVKKDFKKAFEMYEKAANAGDSTAYNKLGYLSENGMGVEKDEVKAAGYYKKGAEADIGACLYNYAVFNDDGRGGLKKDPAEAFRLHYKGAMTGFTPCQLALATRYREGVGVSADPQAALAWYQRAMQKGDLRGALNVAAILENGTSGIVDNKTAAGIYLKAAAGGSAQAMASLAAMMEDGRGVQGDFKQIYLFYTVGTTAAVKGAGERLKQFKSRLSAAQLKEAEEFTAQHQSNPKAVVPVLDKTAAATAPAPAPAVAAPGAPPPAPAASPPAKPGTGKPGTKTGSRPSSR